MAYDLNPYLALAGTAREAMEFYQSVLGGELSISTYGDSGMEDSSGLVMHALLVTAKGNKIMASDVFPGMPHRPGDSVALSLSGDDDDLAGYFDALAADGEITVPFEKQMWGDQYGQVRDSFGIIWHVNRTASAPS